MHVLTPNTIHHFKNKFISPNICVSTICDHTRSSSCHVRSLSRIAGSESWRLRYLPGDFDDHVGCGTGITGASRKRASQVRLAPWQVVWAPGEAVATRAAREPVPPRPAPPVAVADAALTEATRRPAAVPTRWKTVSLQGSFRNHQNVRSLETSTDALAFSLMSWTGATFTGGFVEVSEI